MQTLLTPTAQILDDVTSFWNGDRTIQAGDLFAPEFVGHHGPFGDLVGAAAVAEYVTLARSAFPTLEYGIAEFSTDGETVTATWIAENLDGDDLLRGSFECRIADGRIVESEGTIDPWLGY